MAQTPAPTPPPVADFFRAPQLTLAKLSPDGRYGAAVRKLEQTGRHSLVVIDLQGERTARTVAAFADIDVLEPHWAGNDQIVFTLWDAHSSLFHQRGQGLYAVDRDGRSDARGLIRRSFEAVAEVRVSSTEVRTRPRDHTLDAGQPEAAAQVLLGVKGFDFEGPLPTIVLVHGGPWVRGGDWAWAWAWDADSQFLASRGHLVLEPEFRGSTGYGQKLFSAAFKQRGQAMQDDLVDALDWAVKQGQADPKRVCIAGASYGGYAALMGLVKQADRFRCAVEWVGVTDIGLMHSSDWSDLPGDWKRYGLPAMVGDPKTDAAMLEANSPLRQAARIQRPVFMAHGRQDMRVPIEHGDALHAALCKHGAEVEYHRYAEEGHGFMLDKNEIDFWTRVEAFLARHLKP